MKSKWKLLTSMHITWEDARDGVLRPCLVGFRDDFGCIVYEAVWHCICCALLMRKRSQNLYCIVQKGAWLQILHWLMMKRLRLLQKLHYVDAGSEWQMKIWTAWDSFPVHQADCTHVLLQDVCIRWSRIDWSAECNNLMFQKWLRETNLPRTGISGTLLLKVRPTEISNWTRIYGSWKRGWCRCCYERN